MRKQLFRVAQEALHNVVKHAERRDAMHVEEGRRRLAVQAWEWDGDQYDVRLYLTEEHPDGTCETQLLRSRFYAISVGRLLQLMREAGFVETERRDGVLFQPVLVGIRPSG